MQPHQRARLIAILERGIREQQEALEIVRAGEGQGGLPGPAFGEADHIAYLHMEAERKKGAPLTLRESLDIRREVYGAKSVQGSAGLFGRKGSNHILYRDVPHGKRRNLNQLVYLTDHGKARAEAYAEAKRVAV